MQTSGKKMRLKTKLTKKDIITALICVVLLLLNFGAIGNVGRRRAKRTICLTNLRQLTLAWTQFAYDNDGKIVNGDTEEYGVDPDNPCWVRRDWAPGMTLAQKEQAIREGALWPYCQELKLYKCPIGARGVARTYCIVDAMNCKGWDAYRVKITKITDILNPGERAVFIDEGGFGMGGWTQYSIYSSNRWVWWDPPPIQHENGMTLSFADCHSEYWKWKDPRTGGGPFSSPQIGNQDITRSQIASWGK
jgi:hypothetical protein